ncbi:MAG: D-aminoacyl-tRNA deacylase [Thermodesulfobacteriota bacterium]
MRAVIQRVSQAKVKVSGNIVGEIGPGLLVFLGIGKEDTSADADYLLEKIINLRIFEDEAGKFNLSLLDWAGEIMVVSQFTLYADCRQGRRPSFTAAAPAEMARSLYDFFLERARQKGLRVAAGIFQARMEIELTNVGPVTILLDSSKNFC